MPQSTFDKNLAVLVKRYPEYAEALRNIQAHPLPPPDPSQVENWVKRSLNEQNKQAILFGLAGGHPVEILQRDYLLHQLVIIESRFQNLADAMYAVDLTDALQDECVHWIVEYHPSRIENGLQTITQSLAAHGFQVIKSPVSNPNENSYYDAILQELPGIIERETFSLKALLARGIGVQSNLVHNLPIILDSFFLDEIMDRFGKKPAIIVGAGPSLDKNVHLLKHLNNRALIVCTDTAARTLLLQGIHPHIIITADPSKDNLRHFDDLEIPQETLFAFVSDSYFEIIDKYQHLPRKLCLLDPSNWFNERIRKMLNLRSLIPRSMHAGEAAIRLAVAMGCDPIIFVGLDLAIPNGAQTTHARASARAMSIQYIENNQAQVRDVDGETRTQDLIPVEGIDGEDVLTYYSFKMYLRDLEQTIASTPVQWIDATEGGALKRGCKNQSLAETLAQLDSNLDVENNFSSMHKPPAGSITHCLNLLNEGFQRFQQLELDLRKVASGETTLEEAVSIWDRFLNDKDFRAFADHAIFPFQLLPKIHKIPKDGQIEFLRKHARETAGTLRIFHVFWEDALRRCGKKEDR